MRFEQYLASLRFTPTTIKRYMAWLKSFEIWLHREAKNIETLNYQDLMVYIYEENSRLKRSSLVLLLKRLDWFYQYKQLDNPLEGFRLKSCYNHTLDNLLSAEQLMEIWWVVLQNKRLQAFNKIALGFLVFQGLATTELDHLKVADVDIEKGLLNVPQGLLAARSIDLHAAQVHWISDFIKDKAPSTALLGYKNKVHLSNRHHTFKVQVIKELERAKAKIPFENFIQLRNSRITLWVNQLGLVQAQYLAGHHSLASTQRFRNSSVSELRASLEKTHPLF